MMAEPVEVSMQATPNPNALKFMLNRVVTTQGTTYRLPAAPSAAQAGDAASAEPAWAQQILAIPGVTQVFALNDFLSVNKTPDADWKAIGPRVEAVLRKAFA